MLNKFFSVLSLTVFSIAISLISSFTISTPEQSLEAIRVLVEDGNDIRLVLFFLSALLLVFLLWYSARILTYLIQPNAIHEKGLHGWAARHVPRICSVAPLFAISYAFRKSSLLAALDIKDFLIWLSWFTLVMAIALYLLLYFRRRIINRPIQCFNKKRLSFAELNKTTKIVIIFSLCLWPFCFLIFAFGNQLATFCGSASIILIGLGTLVPIGSMLIYFGKAVRFPIITFIIGLAFAFSYFDLNDNHTIRHENLYSPIPRPVFSNAFSEWLEHRPDLDQYEEYPVFIIAAEGGGLRAAYFTALVLTSIQDRNPNFANHVFAISGVSGGSIGSSVFASLVARYPDNPISPTDSLEDGFLQQKAHRILSQDFLSPVLGSFLYPDFLQRFLPFPIGHFDRARFLEKALEDSWKATTNSSEFNQSFYGLWNDFSKQSVPALFLNTTSVETGERMVITNLLPLDERFNRLTSFGDLYPSTDITLSTASVLSARFPVITPVGAMSLKDKKGRILIKDRYGDGGYFENSGTATLFDILMSMRIDNTEAKRKKFNVSIIRIGFKSKITTPTASQGLGELMSPVRTLLNTRGARGATAIRQLNTAFTTFLDNGLPVGETIEFELDEGLTYDMKTRDILSPDKLIKKLKNVSDPVSKKLKSKFSSEIQKKIDLYVGERDLSIRFLQLLTEEFNRIMKEPLYDKEVFSNVKLRSITRELINRENMENESSFELNRFLIEDVYTEEIAKYQQVSLPLGWLLSLQACDEMKRQLGYPRVIAPGESVSWQNVNNEISYGQVIMELEPHK